MKSALMLLMLASASAFVVITPVVRPAAAPLVRVVPAVMREDVEGTGFFDARDPKTGEYVKMTEYTPQITLFMAVCWVLEYCNYHGIPWGTGIWK